MLSFHFLVMRKPTSACPLLASERYSWWPFWRVVRLFYFLRPSPCPITSYFMLFLIISVLLPVLARSRRLVMSLHILRSPVPPLLVLLDPEILSTPFISANPNQLLFNIHPCYLGLGAWLICTLHDGISRPTLPHSPMRVGRRYRSWSTEPR